MIRAHTVRVRVLAAAAGVLGAFAVGGCGGGGDSTRSAAVSTPSATVPTNATVATSSTSATATSTASPRRRTKRRQPDPAFAVGLRIVTLVDAARLVQFPGRVPERRTLVTLVRYPAQGPATRTDVADATPDRAAGPFPLVIFGHGFSVTPGPYARLLRAWARAGYVVAAPIFPLENANAPGGPNESDLINQPRDMSVVITRMVQASAERGGFFAGLLDRHRIAVTGQSDGGETALAIAYDRSFRDRRVRAAVILSGALIPGVAGFDFPAPSPPLLATQGSADTINPPSFTHAFFDIAPPPKYLLTMFGAPHLGPYTNEQPQLRIAQRVTTAFLDRYLKGAPGALRRMQAAGDVAGVSALQADP